MKARRPNSSNNKTSNSLPSPQFAGPALAASVSAFTAAVHNGLHHRQSTINIEDTPSLAVSVITISDSDDEGQLLRNLPLDQKPQDNNNSNNISSIVSVR